MTYTTKHTAEAFLQDSGFTFSHLRGLYGWENRMGRKARIIQTGQGWIIVIR